MKARCRVAGDDGSTAYKVGDTAERDSEWLRRMLVNGLAEPLDGDAKALLKNKDVLTQYKVTVLMTRALELGFKPADIPASVIWKE